MKNQGWNDSYYIFNGEVITGDEPGNVLYGYLGKVMGCSDELLSRVAGYAETKEGTSKPEWGKWHGSEPYGDDLRNQLIDCNSFNIFNELVANISSL